MNPSTGRD